MKKRTKAEKELSIFRKFAEAAGLEVCGEVAQPDPPDIVADIANHGRVAFELVCLNPQSEFFRLEHFFKTDDALERAFAELPDIRRAELSERLADAEVTVMFPPTIPWKQIAIGGLWDLLAKLPRNFDGEVKCSPALAETLWVVRTKDSNGPLFRSLSGGEVPRLVCERVTQKLSRPYDCAEPLELLAYTEHMDIAHCSDIEEVDRIADAHLARSRFRKLWLFDGMLEKIELAREKPPAAQTR